MSIELEYAIKKDIRNNPVVREIDFEQKRQFRRTLLLAGLIVAMLLFSAWQHLRIITSGYRLEEMRGAAGRRRIAQPQAAARARDAAAAAGARGPRRAPAADAAADREEHARHRARSSGHPGQGDRRARALRGAMIKRLLDRAARRGARRSDSRSSDLLDTAERPEASFEQQWRRLVRGTRRRHSRRARDLGGRARRQAGLSAGRSATTSWRRARGSSRSTSSCRPPSAATSSTGTARSWPIPSTRQRSSPMPWRSRRCGDGRGAVPRAGRLHGHRDRGTVRASRRRRAMDRRALGARRLAPSGRAVAALEAARHHADRRDAGGTTRSSISRRT